MTEAIGTTESDSNYPHLQDPAIEYALSLAREYQHELDGLPDVNEDYARDMLEDLSAAWPFDGQFVTVTGRVRSPVLDYETNDDKDRDRVEVGAVLTESGQVEECDSYPTNLACISQGFCIEKTSDQIMVGGMSVGYRSVIKLLFDRRVELCIDKEMSRQYQLPASAYIDEVVVSPVSPSLDGLEELAGEYFPDVLTKIDEIAGRSLSASQSIIAMKQIEVDVSSYANDFGLAIDDRTLEKLADYMDECAGIQQERLPFYIGLDQGAVIFDSDERDRVLSVVREDACTLVEVLGVRLFTKMVPKGADEEHVKCDIFPAVLEPRLAVKILHAESDSDEVELRLADINSLMTVRESFYGDPDEE